MKLIINILIWSLLVGLLLAWLQISPGELLRDVLAVLGELPELLADLFGWAWPYIVTGAVIVVPLALIGLLLRLFSGRRRGPREP